MESEDEDDAFDRLFRSTFHRVMAYCLRRTDETAAHDAVAEVYAVAWRRRKHLPGDERAAALWLLGAARRVLANQARGKRRWARLLRRAAEHHPRPAAPRQTGPDDTADGAGEDLREAMAGLSVADQELLRLAYWDDLSPADIATVLAISVGAVHTRLHRARQRLRSRLAPPKGPNAAPKTIETKVMTRHAAR